MFLIKVNQPVDNKRTFHWRIWSENKKQGAAFAGNDLLVICCVRAASSSSSSSQNRPLLFEMGRIKMFKDFLLLPAPRKGHKSNVIIAHNCRKGKHMPGDDMNIQTVNCNFIFFAKQNFASFFQTTKSIALTGPCEAAQLQAVVRLTSAWPPQTPPWLLPPWEKQKSLHKD